LNCSSPPNQGKAKQCAAGHGLDKSGLGIGGYYHHSRPMKTKIIVAFCGLCLTAAAQFSNNPAVQFITLHHTTPPSATIVWNGNTTHTVTFPRSTTFGWNEIQALIGGDLTNQDHVGFTLRIDPGLYTFTSQLVISNTMNFDGGNPASCIFEYVGPTNFCTMNDMTNMLSLFGSTFEAGMNQSLMSFHTNAVMVSGEDGNNINCILKNFSLVTKTNMFCILIGNIYGDHTLLQNVWVGGPQLFDSKNAHSGWVNLSDIREPPKMVGFVIGQNQVVLRDCSAFAVADGVVAMGNAFVTLDHFNGICCGNYYLDNGASAFPATSELSLGAAIMIPSTSQVATMIVNGNSLSYKCGQRFYVGNNAPAVFYDFNDQYSRYSGLAKLCTSPASIIRLGTSSQTPLLAITNSPYGFGVDTDLQVETVYLRPIKLLGKLLGTGISFGSWWSPQQADLICGIGISLIGCFGGLIGLLVLKGRARNFVLAAVKYIIVLGILLTIAGLVAAVLNQPYAVWYALLLPGVILVLVFSLNLHSIQRRYDELEIRRMTSIDRQGS
jgi:hypothetical protein